MKQFLKQHSFIFLFAFVIGALIVFPTIFVISKIGPDFKGVFPMFNNDETHYIAMTREAYDGHYNFGNVYLKEHKDVMARIKKEALTKAVAPVEKAETEEE